MIENWSAVALYVLQSPTWLIIAGLLALDFTIKTIIDVVNLPLEYRLQQAQIDKLKLEVKRLRGEV